MAMKYHPVTPEESRALSPITNALFESITGFKGLIVYSLAERLSKTWSPTYQITGAEMAPLHEKIRLFLIRIRMGMRYPALAEMFDMEVESAQRFCQARLCLAQSR